MKRALFGFLSRSREDLGRRGEKMAAKELERRGFEILDARWKCRLGEIDLVARDGETLVIVEVKARSGAGFGGPLAAVDRRKQRKLVALTRAYLKARRLGEVPIRFDVVGIVAPSGERPDIQHVRGAFVEL